MKIENHDYDLIKLGFEGEQAITQQLFFKYGKTFEPKKIILKEGDTGQDVYIIISGMVLVTEKQKSGQYRVLNRLGAGEIFGEMALLENEVRSATLISATDVKLLILSPEQFEKIFQTHPRWAFKIIGALCRRIQSAFTQISNFYSGKTDGI